MVAPKQKEQERQHSREGLGPLGYQTPNNGLNYLQCQGKDQNGQVVRLFKGRVEGQQEQSQAKNVAVRVRKIDHNDGRGNQEPQHRLALGKGRFVSV